MSERPNIPIWQIPVASLDVRQLMSANTSKNINSKLINVHDRLNRPIHDLRLSVTDRCNFRCSYCMPAHIFDKEHIFLPRKDILTFEEMERTVRLLLPFGLRKIRLTGGEPLLRQNLAAFIKTLNTLKAIDGKPLDITLTTNASLLARHLPALIAAGLKRITVSLDAIDEQTFSKMNAVGFSVVRVLSAIDAAVKSGIKVKINMVVIRDTNEQEVLPMVDYFRQKYLSVNSETTAVVLRFIEFMDVGNNNGWHMKRVVSADDILANIATKYPLRLIPENYRGEVARRYGFDDNMGEIGIVASVSAPFCRDCSRLRLSADGQFYTCLFGQEAHDWRQSLRMVDGEGNSDNILSQKLVNMWQNRNDHYSEIRTLAMQQSDASANNVELKPKVEMSYIGG